MPSPFQPQTLNDFLSSFGGGVNEGDSPLDIGKDVMAGAVNTTVRGKYVTHRPAYHKRTIYYSNVFGQISPTQQAVEQGQFQGACMDAVDDFGNASLVALISQRLFQFAIAGNSLTCLEILIPGGPTSPVQPQAWLWQAERWVIVQDGVSQPIFFDLNTQTARRSNGTAPLSAVASAFSSAGIPANGSGTATFTSVANLATGNVISTSLGNYTVTGISGFNVGLISQGNTSAWIAGSAATIYPVSWSSSNTGNYSGTAGSALGIVGSIGSTGYAVLSDATDIGQGDTLEVGDSTNGYLPGASAPVPFTVLSVDPSTSIAQLQNTTATPWPQSSFGVSWTYTGSTITGTTSILVNGNNKFHYYNESSNFVGFSPGDTITISPYGTYTVTSSDTSGGVNNVSLASGSWPPTGGRFTNCGWSHTPSGTVNGTAYSTAGIPAGTTGTLIFSTTTGLVASTTVVTVTGLTGMTSFTIGSFGTSAVQATMPGGVAWPQFSYDTTWTHTATGSGTANATSSLGILADGTGSAILTPTSGSNLATIVAGQTVVAVAGLGNYMVTGVDTITGVVILSSQTSSVWPAGNATGSYDAAWQYVAPNNYSATAQSTGDIPAGQSGTATFSSVTNLSVGDYVTVGTLGAFQVSAINGYVVSFTNSSNSDWPSGTNYTTTWTNTVSQMPPGRMGAYGMGRNWITLPDGLHFVASDIVGGSSGTAYYNYRDAVLSMQENTFIVGGGAFSIPASGGETIKAMRFLTTLDASLGQGPLQVFTNRRVFSCNAPVDRLTWQSLTNPILTVSLIHNGALGQNSTVLANSDAIFRSYDGVRSLILGRQEDNTWGRTPISFEVHPRLDQDDLSILNFTSAAVFDNRMLLTEGPVQDSQGVYFQGLVPLNMDPSSSLRGKLPSVWDSGVWTGSNILQLGVATVSNVERALCFVLNTAPGSKRIEIWEILPSDGPLSAIADNDGVNDIPITWRFDSAALRFGVKRDDRKYMSLSNGEIWVDDVIGTVSFNIQYRPDQYPIWTPWRNWQECQTVDSTISQPGFRPRMGLGEPSPQPNDPTSNRPMRNGFTFQTRNIIQGHCVILGAFYEAQTQPMPKFAPIACGALCLGQNFIPNAMMGQLVPYTFGTPPPPTDVTIWGWAYDPNGILPSMGWNPSTQTWN